VFLQSQSLPKLAIFSVQSAYYILVYEISLLCIPIQRLFCKPNPETGFRDSNFLSPRSGC